MKSLLTLIVIIPLAVNAGEVIYDTGNTISASKYRFDSEPSKVKKKKPSVGKLVSPRTPEMTLGKVQKRRVKLPYLPHPLFLIGTDKTSLAWLRHHAPRLKKAGAKGLVVNSGSPKELKALIRAASGVDISPASGSELAKRMNLKHYPVLITRTQIAQ